MTGVANPNERLRAVRAQLDHPIVDADAHQLEVLAVVMDFVRDVGGPKMPDRLINYFMHARRAFRQTVDEREAQRTSVPVWWPVPTENTHDRAATALPGYLYERMDDIGLDFSIVYPGQGLLVITCPVWPTKSCAVRVPAPSTSTTQSSSAPTATV